MSSDWLDEVADALGVDRDVIEQNMLLGLARDVAHRVERKAAPLSAFIVGYAAGAAGADGQGVVTLVEQVREMCPPEVESGD